MYYLNQLIDKVSYMNYLRKKNVLPKNNLDDIYKIINLNCYGIGYLLNEIEIIIQNSSEQYPNFNARSLEEQDIIKELALLKKINFYYLLKLKIMIQIFMYYINNYLSSFPSDLWD